MENDAWLINLVKSCVLTLATVVVIKCTGVTDGVVVICNGIIAHPAAAPINAIMLCGTLVGIVFSF